MTSKAFLHRFKTEISIRNLLNFWKKLKGLQIILTSCLPRHNIAATFSLRMNLLQEVSERDFVILKSLKIKENPKLERELETSRDLEPFSWPLHNQS